jgi:hypothetical protein
MKATDREKTLELLSAGRTPEQQAKLSAAWEKYAEGDSESMPAVFAMAQLHIVDVHASMMDREAELLAEFQEVCQEQRLIFQSAVSQETQAILNGFEKRQAIFEQKQQLASESRTEPATPKKAGGLLSMVFAAVIGILGSGYAVNQYNQKQFQADKDLGQAMVKSIHKAGGQITSFTSIDETNQLYQVIKVIAPTDQLSAYCSKEGHGIITLKQPK